MDQAIKEQWVTALRSGEYEQGRLALTEDGKYCCLGVLCELAVKAGVIGKHTRFSHVYYDAESSILPYSVSEWAGLDDNETPQNPIITVTDSDGVCSTAVAVLNDGDEGFDRHSFAQIADLIEAQL